MRDTRRIERIIGMITEIWMKQPDSRFMQMISNMSWKYSNNHNGAYKQYSYSKWGKDDMVAFKKDIVNVDCFHLEDDKLEEFLETYLVEINLNKN